jgi:hypothetical protein
MLLDLCPEIQVVMVDKSRDGMEGAKELKVVLVHELLLDAYRAADYPREAIEEKM